MARTISQTINLQARPESVSKYITDLTSAGIIVHPENFNENDSATQNYIQLDGNGLNIYKNGISVAEYGDNTRIGEEEGAAFYVNANSLQAYYVDDENNKQLYFQVTPNSMSYGIHTVVSEDDIDSITDKISLRANQITFENNTTIASELTTLKNAITINTNEQTIKVGANDFYILISPAEMGFYQQGENRIAYMNGSELYVENSLSFGTFVFTQRQNGHFTLKKID